MKRLTCSYISELSIRNGWDKCKSMLGRFVARLDQDDKKSCQQMYKCT